MDLIAGTVYSSWPALGSSRIPFVCTYTYFLSLIGDDAGTNLRYQLKYTEEFSNLLRSYKFESIYLLTEEKIDRCKLKQQKIQKG